MERSLISTSTPVDDLNTGDWVLATLCEILCNARLHRRPRVDFLTTSFHAACNRPIRVRPGRARAKSTVRLLVLLKLLHSAGAGQPLFLELLVVKNHLSTSYRINVMRWVFKYRRISSKVMTSSTKYGTGSFRPKKDGEPGVNAITRDKN